MKRSSSPEVSWPPTIGHTQEEVTALQTACAAGVDEIAARFL